MAFYNCSGLDGSLILPKRSACGVLPNRGYFKFCAWLCKFYPLTDQNTALWFESSWGFYFPFSPRRQGGGRHVLSQPCVHAGSYFSSLTHREWFWCLSCMWGGLLLYSPSCASFVSWWYIKQHHVKSLLALLTLYYSNPTCKWEIMKDLVQSLWTWESEEEAQRPFWPGDCFNGQLVLSLHSLELDSQIIHFTLNANLSWVVFQ